MDVSELEFIRQFAEAHEKIDFDFLIKQLLSCEESPELEKITEINNLTTGQKRRHNLKSANLKQTKSTTDAKLKQDKSETDVEILCEEHSKSCQTALFINGAVVSDWPDSSLESKAGLNLHHEALKTYGNRSKCRSVIFNKRNKNTGSKGLEVETVDTESTSQLKKIPELNKAIPTHHVSDTAESSQNEHLKDLSEHVSNDLTGKNSNIANAKFASNSIGFEHHEASLANNEDDLSTSKIPRLSIDEIGVDNQENSPLQKHKQSLCEEVLELTARISSDSDESKNMDADENPSHINGSCIASSSRKETTDATLVADKIPFIPQINKNCVKDHVDKSIFLTDYKSEMPLNNDSNSRWRQNAASSDTHFEESNKKHQDGTESNCLRKEGDELNHNRVTAKQRLEHVEETANAPSAAMNTENLRDIAFPNSLCSILYEELLDQDRTHLDNLAITLEQAQKKCYTLIPRTTEERRDLLESQRQARRERNLNTRNDRLDYLKQHCFDIIIRFLEIKVQETVKFAKCIPGFKTLDIDDQITLIKDVKLANVRPHVCRCINSETQLVTFMPGLHIGFEEICEVFTEGMREQMEMCETKSNKINITEREEAVVQAVLIMSAGRNHHLKDLEKIEEIYRNLVSCLLHVVSMESKPVFERMEELSDLILFCRQLKEPHQTFMLREILQQSTKSGDNKLLHELFYS